MKVGINHSAYTDVYGFEKGLHLLREEGYECIDYQDFVDTDRPMFAMTERDFDAFLREQRSVIEGEGLEISQTHGPWRWPTRDATAEDRAERFDKMARSIRGTAILGCRNFIIHPVLPWGDNNGPDPQKLYELNLEFMARLTEVAQASGVVICFENMPMRNLLLASPEACLRFANEINSPNFKLCLDTGHCSVLGIQPATAVRQLGKEMLQTLHIHDNDGCVDRHWLPYTGVIDWDDFAQALQETGFEGAASLETWLPPKFTGEMRKLQERSLYLSIRRIAGGRA